MGKVILERGEMLHTDPFAGTESGEERQWILYEWLLQVVSALLVIGGGALFFSMMSLIFAPTFVYLFWLMLKRNLHMVLALLLTIVAYIVICWHFLARPHVMTYFSKEAIAYISQNKANKGRTYNPDYLGDALIYYFGLELKVSMDDRADVFNDKLNQIFILERNELA